MKKIILLLLSVMLLVGIAAKTQAAGTAYWSGPETLRAGDTVTLTFYAGGDILGGSCTLSYDESQLTLKGLQQKVGGNWVVEQVGKNIVFYDNEMSSPISGAKAIFSLTFSVSNSLQTGEQITVSATGVTLSDGQQDMGIGTVSYIKTVAPPLSDNCDLQNLRAEGVSLSPAFSPATTYYSGSVPFSTASVGISWETAHPGAKVSLTNPKLKAGETTTISVTVTAEKGNSKTYYIAIARAQDPNYVPDSNCVLSALSVEGYQLSPGFDPKVTGYYVWLPYETEKITLQAAAESPKAQVRLPEDQQLPAGMGTALCVTVIAEDGTENVYTVIAVRAPAYEDAEAFLQGQREPEPTQPPETQPPQAEPTTQPPVTTEPVEELPAQPQNPRSFPWLAVLATAEGLIIVILLLIKKKR